MAGGCQTAGERPYFDRGTSHIKKGVVGLGDMQEAHRNLSFRRACSARLQAGILGSSTCSPEGERYTLALGWHMDYIAREKTQKDFPCRELYSREPPSDGRLVNSLLSGKNIGQ